MAGKVSCSPVVLVTGGSRGIGLSIVKVLLNGSKTIQQKSNVVTISRSEPEPLKELLKEFPTQLKIVKGDCSKGQDCKNAVELAMETYGRLDAIILNAATITYTRLADGDPDELVNEISSNLSMILQPIHYATPHLRTSPTNCGKIVFVSSGASTGQTASWGAYNAGKAALNSIARTLANEEKQLAIWAIRPGVVDTEMQKSIRAKAKKEMDPKEYVRFEELHKNGKLLPAEKPAHVLAALAVLGTREEPKVDQEGAGAKGAYMNWESEELKDFRLP